MTEFEDIRITGMDKEDSKIADSGHIEIHLKLSSMPDNAWKEIFKRMHRRHFSPGEAKPSRTQPHIVMNTRRERAKALKDKLETDVADTNAEYRKLINERARRKAEEAEAQRVRQEKERKQLDDIDRLLFGED